MALLAFGGSVVVAGAVGGRFGPRPGSATQKWYASLRKPLEPLLQMTAELAARHSNSGAAD